jgi:hypothetical protein
LTGPNVFGLSFTFSRWSLTGFWRRQMKTNNPGVTQPQLNNQNQSDAIPKS